MQPALSVVIPTHGRAAILRECLKRLDAQTVRDRLEVIVVSDGHDPQTSELFAEVESGKWKVENNSPLNIRCLEIPKSHQGVARNRGVDLATADLVLFISDDIFLAPDACEKHLIAHQKKLHHSQFLILNSQFKAVLGHTTWDPELTITKTMQWLERGWQFGYPKIARYAHAFLPAEIQHSFTYTSHVSLPTAIAKKMRFREDVSLYGWEDMEWGLRLREAGVRLSYEPDAKAFHHHAMTLEQSLRRMETIGRSAAMIEKLNPRLRVIPRGMKRIAYDLTALLPTLRGKHAKALLQGIASARRS